MQMLGSDLQLFGMFQDATFHGGHQEFAALLHKGLVSLPALLDTAGIPGVHTLRDYGASRDQKLSGASCDYHQRWMRFSDRPNSATAEYSFPCRKAPQLGRELPWKLNHSSPSLAINPAGINMERRLLGRSPGALLDLILRCRKMKRRVRTDGSIPHAADGRIPCRCKRTHFHTLLAETGLAGFPGNSSPSGGPS